jgi:hypothetical protein
MRIDPAGAGKASGADLRRTTGAVPKDRAEGTGPHRSGGTEARRDEITISDAARELLGASEGASAPRALDPGRAREVLGRIASGYYDRPEVRSEVLDRLAAGLGLSPSD